MDIEWIRGPVAAQTLTAAVSLTKSGKCSLAAELAEKLMAHSEYVRLGRDRTDRNRFVLDPCGEGDQGRMRIRRMNKHRSYGLDAKGKLAVCGVLPQKDPVLCPAHWDAENEVVVFLVPEQERVLMSETRGSGKESDSSSVTRGSGKGNGPPAVPRDPENESRATNHERRTPGAEPRPVGIGGTCRDCTSFTAKGVRGLGECDNILSPKCGTVASSMTCKRFRRRDEAPPPPRERRSYDPQQLPCPVCGKEVAVYTWRAGRAKLRPHHNPDGDKCPGNREYFEPDSNS